MYFDILRKAVRHDRQQTGSMFFPTFGEIESVLRASIQPGDLVLTVGAGDVYKIGEDLVSSGK